VIRWGKASRRDRVPVAEGVPFRRGSGVVCVGVGGFDRGGAVPGHERSSARVSARVGEFDGGGSVPGWAGGLGTGSAVEEEVSS
jgi:hypothetical protein